MRDEVKSLFISLFQNLFHKQIFHKQIFKDKSYERYSIANAKNKKGFKNKKINLKQTGNEYLPK